MDQRPRLVSARTAIVAFVVGVVVMQIGLLRGWPIVAIVGNAIGVFGGVGYLLRRGHIPSPVRAIKKITHFLPRITARRILIAAIILLPLFGWATWQQMIVRQRNNTRRETYEAFFRYDYAERHKLNWLRMFLGDLPVEHIWIWPITSAEKEARLKNAFPEATIVRLPEK